MFFLRDCRWGQLVPFRLMVGTNCNSGYMLGCSCIFSQREPRLILLWKETKRTFLMKEQTCTQCFKNRSSPRLHTMVRAEWGKKKEKKEFPDQDPDSHQDFNHPDLMFEWFFRYYSDRKNPEQAKHPTRDDWFSMLYEQELRELEPLM